MKELVIPVKFTSEDVVYTTRLIKEEKVCDICEGSKAIEYRGKQMKCPECGGTGVFKSNKQINVVVDDPFEIQSIKIKVGKNGSTTVGYKGKCKHTPLNRSEDNLFSSKEEAQKRCDCLNMDRSRIRLQDIIIDDSMKSSSPSPEKLKDRYEHYQNTGQFKKKIFINQDNVLVDGYITYLICKMIDKDFVQVIVTK